jgi:hypothetical protein
VIEFQHGEIQLAEGQMTTIPRGFVTVLGLPDAALLT